MVARELCAAGSQSRNHRQQERGRFRDRRRIAAQSEVSNGYRQQVGVNGCGARYVREIAIAGG
jgi:hypothetical protein